MPSTTFYPSLSTLIPLENIPNELGSFKNGLTNIFNKLYYRDLQIHKSALGDAAFYNLKIVTYRRIALEIGGANGLSLIFNPSLDENIAGANSEFDVSLSYKWEILKYFKDFDLQSFDYSGAAIFNLILVITGLNKQKLLSEAIFLFIEDPDPIQKFVDDFNANPTYNPTTLLVPISDPDVEVVISDLLDQLIANGNDFNAYEIVFESFLYNTNSFGDVFDKVEILFQKWLGAFTIQDLKNLLIPQATASFNIDFGLEFPISILRQVNVLGQPLLDPLTQKDIPAILVCSGGSFSFNSKNGFLFQPDYALSFIN